MIPIVLRSPVSPKESMQILQETIIKSCLCKDTTTDASTVAIGTHNRSSRFRIVISVERDLRTIMEDAAQAGDEQPVQRKKQIAEEEKLDEKSYGQARLCNQVQKTSISYLTLLKDTKSPETIVREVARTSIV